MMSAICNGLFNRLSDGLNRTYNCYLPLSCHRAAFRLTPVGIPIEIFI